MVLLMSSGLFIKMLSHRLHRQPSAKDRTHTAFRKHSITGEASPFCMVRSKSSAGRIAGKLAMTQMITEADQA